ncbi:hypothetical protein DFS33DRAFT_1380643 [Desarmillaria ectypa]|nr:hypothetical protein DFS33DRAFT_1380643 [Desarmillaria ectypa]
MSLYDEWGDSWIACSCIESLVTNLAEYVSLLTFISTQSSLSFNVTNTFLFEITFNHIVSVGINTTEYISFDHTFEDPIVVPILGTAYSGVIEDMALPQGGLDRLDIVSLGHRPDQSECIHEGNND